MSRVCLRPIHSPSTSLAKKARSMPRGERRSISSTTAAWRNEANFSRAMRRLFSRSVTSRSIMRPRRCSKASAAMSGWRCWSSKALAMPASPRAARRSWVWLTSMSSPSAGSMEVAAATNVVVLDRVGLRGGLGEEGLVEAGLEDRGDGPVARRSDGGAAAAGCLEAERTVGAPQRQDAEARSESLFGMRLRAHDRLAQRDGGRANLASEGDDARRRPGGMPTMRARHMLGDRGVTMLHRRTRVACDPHAAMKHLDGRLRGPHLDDSADQAGRHRIEVPLDLDVVIRRHRGAPPLGILVRFDRHRQQGGPIDGLKKLAAAGAELAHEATVEFIEQRTDRRVQLDKRKEAPVAQ